MITFATSNNQKPLSRYRPRPIFCHPINQGPQIRPEKRRDRSERKKIKKEKRPMQKITPRLQDPTLLVKKKSLAKVKGRTEVSRTFLRLFIGTMIKKAIIPPIILNIPKQKTNCNFNNLHVNDCQPGSFITYLLYLISSLISRSA